MMNVGAFSLDLALLQTAAYFDLDDPKERGRSALLLRDLTVGLHDHISPGATFEIGACEATFSKAVRRHAPDARIYAFEANPHIFEAQRSQDAFGELGIQYLHRAISHHSGTTTLYLQTKRDHKQVSPHVMSNSLLKRTKSAEYDAITVPCSSLSDFIDGEGLRGTVSTAWIDVEGAIEYVLKGLGDCLDQFHLLHCEVEDRDKWRRQWLAHDVLSFLGKKGFTPIARDFESKYQYNILLLREAVLRLPPVRSAIAEHYSGLGMSRLNKHPEY